MRVRFKNIKNICLCLAALYLFRVDGHARKVEQTFFMEIKICIGCGVNERYVRKNSNSHSRYCLKCIVAQNRNKKRAQRVVRSETLIEGEMWKSVVGYESLCEVSNLGRVRSLSRTTQYTQKEKVYEGIYGGRILSPAINHSGYPVVVIHTDGKGKTVTVHRLVCMAFHPNPENKETVNHINGIKTDNRPENLEWATRSENVRHAVDTGLKPSSFGEKNGSAKLTDSHVLEIRSKRPTKKLAELALEYGVTETMISNICLRKAWKHI